MTSPSETIEKAMEGVTPGDWHDAPGTTTGRVVLALKTTKAKRRVAALGGPDREANADYIAACSPARMREVLDELYALRETALQLEAMEREMAGKEERIAALEAGMTPFAAVADVYDGTAVEDLDPILSTDGPRLVAGDLRRARTLIQGEKP